MAMLQLKCPETGKPVDIREHQPDWGVKAHGFSRLVPCPHCGKSHAWTSHDEGLAHDALQHSPDTTRVLVEGEKDSRSATAFL
jgi:hypothetical protein